MKNEDNTHRNRIVDIVSASIIAALVAAAGGTYVTTRVLSSDMIWIQRTFVHLSNRLNRQETQIAYLEETCRPIEGKQP